MKEETYQKIEEIADNLDVDNFASIQTLLFHAEAMADDFTEDLKELESIGKKKAVKRFEHYDKVVKNIIGYCYVKLAITLHAVYECKEEIESTINKTSKEEAKGMKKALDLVNQHLPEDLKVKI